MKKFGIGLIAIAATLAITPSALADTGCYDVPGNIVTNCGFETGDTTGWTLTYANSGSEFAVTGGPSGLPTNNGSFAADFGAYGDEYDTLSQTLTTASSTDYTLTFWLSDAGGDGAGSDTDFQALWDGTSLLDQYTTTNGYVEYTFDVTGIGSNTLTFEGYNGGSWYELDDVSVAPSGVSATPEPSSFLLLGTGLVGLFGLLLRRRFAAL